MKMIIEFPSNRANNICGVEYYPKLISLNIVNLIFVISVIWVVGK